MRETARSYLPGPPPSTFGLLHKILWENIGKKRQYGLYLTNQSASAAEQNPNKLGWKTREATKEQTEKKRRKRRQLVTDRLPKKGAKPCHKCGILANQTVRR